VPDRPFAYAIHPDDTIASVSDSWLEFAHENRAPELTRDYVVGRSLWSFVAGSETRLLYEALFHRVRTRAESFELPFRCDSPDRFRFMRLIVKHGPGDLIDCEGILVREQARPFYTILDRAFPRTTARLPMCSLCKRVYALGARWLELEVAIEQLNLFDTASLPEIEYAVCDDCRSAGRRASGSGTAA
jgi:hypothetical protein